MSTYPRSQVTQRRTPHRLRRLRLWMPVMPFVVFWIGAITAYEVGPIVNPRLAPATYVYLVLAFLAIVGGYRRGLSWTCGSVTEASRHEKTRALELLQWSAPVSCLGTAGLVLDRLLSGAGSVAKTLLETETVRDFEMNRTTLLTTLSVAPYSVSFVALACFFYCKASGVRVSNVTAWAVYLQLVLVLFNAFLGANRGVFFWIATYGVFFVAFAREGGIRGTLQESRKKERLAFVLFAVVGVIYTVFIAGNRDGPWYIKSMARQAQISGRFDASGYDETMLGTYVSLLNYGTSEFRYIDAFVERAEPLAFRPALLVGVRVLGQVRRFDPSFARATEEISAQWILSAGLSPWGWASVFGYPLIMFGWLGALIFFLLLGMTFGAAVKRAVTRQEVGMLIVVFCLYAAMNTSFNWIGGDVTHNVGYAVGLWMVATAPKPRVRLWIGRASAKPRWGRAAGMGDG
jgi:oligosaccharide repeat unit polymerase